MQEQTPSCSRVEVGYWGHMDGLEAIIVRPEQPY